MEASKKVKRKRVVISYACSPAKCGHAEAWSTGPSPRSALLGKIISPPPQPPPPPLLWRLRKTFRERLV